MPAWDGLHPLVVHFPIALLLIAPILIILGLCLGRLRTGLLLAAWVLMFIGTVGAYVAVSTGEAAEDFAVGDPGVEEVLHEHEELAELARNAFTAYTVAYGLILAGHVWTARRLARVQSGPQHSPRQLRMRRTVFLAAHAIFLFAYAAGTLVLINAAHLGGRVVHEFGVRAILKGAPPAHTDQ